MAVGVSFAADPVADAASSPTVAPAKRVAFVIPVRDEIAKPTLYIIRRGLKEAVEQKADLVVLDMKTPGGALDSTLEIMEALGKFPGKTATFVDDQALSAGAFIAATTEEIWFAPRGKIGAAAPVDSSGKDIDKTMRQKVVSFLRAEVRSISEGKGLRGQVVSAMIDEDFELKVGDAVLKPKGELLTLTASEAMKTYGEPAQPLLGAGIANDISALLTKKFGAGNFEVREFRVTWSESLAQYLTAFAPILTGLGLLALFLEFKMPSHGLFAGVGILLLLVVFFGHYVAGFSGHEPVLLFTLGLLLVLAEVLFFPGVALPAVTGLVLMLVALVWSMADLWPNEPIQFSGEAFARPLSNVGLGVLLSVAFGVALLRFLPQGWIWDRLTVNSVAGSVAQSSTGGARVSDLIGASGVAATALRPGGQIEVGGRRYEARAALGSIAPGTRVVVRARDDFALVVEEDKA
ncbi:MAG: ATP-dependent Clp protease proteolytic subunit [Candidatus Didemnitutus sp.]|nr:ATP-dependent Clp protease proteolytic subunit [Candidatus Didemnitutus sp.]